MPKKGPPLLSPQVVELVAGRFRLLSEPMRLRILQELHEGERSVGDLAEMLTSSQPNVSKHLKALQEAGIVRRRAAGNSAYYSISDATVFELCEVVCGGLRERFNAQAAALAPR